MKQPLLRLASLCVIVGAIIQFLSTKQVLKYQPVAYDNNVGGSAEIQAALPPVHWNSSWVGKTWIPPPGYVVYSPQSIRAYFSRRSVLYVGDSTARRAMNTFFAIVSASNLNDVTLEEVDSNGVVNAGKGNPLCHREGYTLCYPMPSDRDNSTGKELNYMNHPCLSQLTGKSDWWLHIEYVAFYNFSHHQNCPPAPYDQRRPLGSRINPSKRLVTVFNGGILSRPLGIRSKIRMPLQRDRQMECHGGLFSGLDSTGGPIPRNKVFVANVGRARNR